MLGEASGSGPFGFCRAVYDPQVPWEMGGNRLVGGDYVCSRDEIIEGCSGAVLDVVEMDDHSVGEVAPPFVREMGARFWQGSQESSPR